MLMVILVVIWLVSWKDRLCTSDDVYGCYNGQNQEHNEYNTAEDNGQDEAHCKDVDNALQFLGKLPKNELVFLELCPEP